MLNQFNDFIKLLNSSDCKEVRKDAANKAAAIVVTPWVVTPVPLFSLVMALAYHRNGWNTYVVLDDLPTEGNPYFPEQIEKLRQILKHSCFSDVNVIILSELAASELDDSEYQEVSSLVFQNAIWLKKGVINVERDPASVFEVEKRLLVNSKRIKTLFKEYTFDHCLVPGGIFSNSGLYLRLARKHGIRVATYDSGDELLLIGVNNVAAYQFDVRTSLVKYLAEFSSAEMDEKLIAIAKEEFENRQHRRDQYQNQYGDYRGGVSEYSADYLIPLNIEWDAAALGRHRYFTDAKDWLTQTIEYIVYKLQRSVIIRQHPYERHFSFGTELSKLVVEKYGNNPLVTFIAATDDVNTYDLMPSVKVVLPNTSTVGIEAAALGKQVICEADVYYAGFGFTHDPADREEYFQLIASLAEQNPPVNIKNAWLCYYFSQICSFYTTNFTPMPSDVSIWIKKDLNSIMEDPGFEKIFKAFSQGEEIAYQVFKERVLVNQAETEKKVEESMEPVNSLAERYPNVHVGKNTQVLGLNSIKIGEGTVIGEDTWLNDCVRDGKIRINIGSNVLVGRRNMISTGGKLEIGDYCIFGPNVYVGDADHNFQDTNLPVAMQGATLGKSLVVEENCWFGMNAIISGGITIGRGSVVAANSVVKNSVPPFSVVAGNPAKILKMLNPETGVWEKIFSCLDVNRIEQARKRSPLPDREAYLQGLKKNTPPKILDPVVAGDGLNL